MTSNGRAIPVRPNPSLQHPRLMYSAGEGFHGAGNHLPGLKLNEYEGRAKGLSAAQKRLDTQRKIGKGGVLGGSGTAGKTMKEVLAEVRALFGPHIERC